MPQAVSIFPNVQSKPPRSNSSTSSSEGGSGKFDEMLDSARQKDSTDASRPKPADDSSSAKRHKSGKSGKSGGSTPAKPAAKSIAKVKPAAAADEESETSEARTEDERAEAASTGAAAPSPDEALAESSAEAGKPKETTHQAQSDDPSADPAQLLAQQRQPAFAIKPVGKDAKQSDADQRGKGAWGKAAIAAISDSQDETADDSSASEAAALSQGGQASAANGRSKPATVKDDGSVGVQAVNPAAGDAASQASSSPADESGDASPDSSADDATAAAPIASLKDAPTPGSQTENLTESQTAPVPVSSPGLHAFSDVLQSASGSVSTAEKKIAGSTSSSANTPAARETEFADANHGGIVSSIKGQLLPNGGSLQLRLDPAELGAVNISVHMRDGVMTATFDTSNDRAARLLTHSLGQLKTALESQGVSVGGLHVQQTPRDSQAGSRDSGQQGGNGSNDTSQQERQQEQQRKEMVRRMWRRLNGGKDPLDLVA